MSEEEEKYDQNDFHEEEQNQDNQDKNEEQVNDQIQDGNQSIKQSRQDEENKSQKSKKNQVEILMIIISQSEADQSLRQSFDQAGESMAIDQSLKNSISQIGSQAQLKSEGGDDNISIPEKKGSTIKKQSSRPASKDTKKLNDKKQSKKPDTQVKMVNQIMKMHKDKQDKLKKLEDKIYVTEEVEKKQPKIQEKPKVKVKQSLVYKKEVQEQLDDPTKSNQQKAQVLMKDLAEKVDKKLPKNAEKPVVPKKIEIKQPDPNTEPKPKPPPFQVKIGAGVKSVIEEQQENDDKSKQSKERTAILEQKKREAEKAKLQLDQLKVVKQKEKEMLKQGQDNLKKENKVLLQEPKPKDKKQSDLQYEESKKEKSENDEILRRQLLVQIRHERENQQDLKNEIEKLIYESGKLDEELKLQKRKANVIDVGGKIQAIGNLGSAKKAEDDLESLASSSLNQTLQAVQGSGFNESTLTEVIVLKIAQQGHTLKDVFEMLDDDGDGVLTLLEIRTNLKNLNLQLSEQETQYLIEQLDQNGDGVLNQQEFEAALTNTLRAQKEFVEIMGDIQDIANPIVLEERKLDLQFRKKLILKQTAIQKKKSEQTRIHYEKIVQQLKDLELKVSSIKGAPSDKKAILKEMKEKTEKLRKELRANQDQKQKMVMQKNEKSQLIDENLSRLTKELTEKCQYVLIAKDTLVEENIKNQKLQLKILALGRINDKFETELKEKSKKELEWMEKQKGIQQNKLKNIAESKLKQEEKQKMTHGIQLIQKHIRGKLTRKRLKKKVENFKKFFSLLIEKLQPLIKEKHLIVFRLFKDCNHKRYEEIILEQSKLKEEMVETWKSKKQMEQTDNKILKDRMLPAVITIQKSYRKIKRKEVHPQKVYNCSFGEFDQKCSICGQDKVAIICRKCHNPFFCFQCFRLSHKNYHRRNHQYYELSDLEKDQIEIEQKKIEMKQQEENDVLSDVLSQQDEVKELKEELAQVSDDEDEEERENN